MPSLKAPAVKAGEKKEENVHVSSASLSASQPVQKSDVHVNNCLSLAKFRRRNLYGYGCGTSQYDVTRRPVDFFFGEETKEAEEEGNSNLVPVPGAQFAEIKVSDIHPKPQTASR